MQQRFLLQFLLLAQHVSGHHYAHHQELKSIIQWLLPVVFRAVVFKLVVWFGAEGYVSGFHITLSSTPDHVEQAMRTAIKTSVASSWHFISTYIREWRQHSEDILI